MRVTIKDLAKELGISAAAVSKALNDKPDISAEIKDKVKSTANRLGYQRNETAARLVSKKSNTIGVFIFARDKIKLEENSAFKFVEVYLDDVKSRGYDVLLFSVDDDDMSDKTILHLCLERNVEGVIIIGAQQNQRTIQEIINYNIPTIFVEAKISGQLTTYISFNDEQGIEKAMDYLFLKGHKKIAFIRGDLRTDVTRERFLTYMRKISEVTLYREDYVFQGNFSLESGYSVASKIASLEDRPTAIMASGDLMAIGLIKGLKTHGIKVPEDISIIGYDGFEVGKYLETAITTINQNFLLMAHRTVEMLFTMIDTKSNVKEEIMDVSLSERESVKSLS